MRVSTSRIGALLGIPLFLSVSAVASHAGSGLATPALLSMNSLTSGSSPELRVVASTLSANSISTEKRFTSGVVMPAPMRGTSERALMHRGVEALARYSYSHADDSPTPWEESIQAPSSESWREREQRMVATTAVRVLSIDEASNVAWGATAFSASRTLDAHSGVAWSAAG